MPVCSGLAFAFATAGPLDVEIGLGEHLGLVEFHKAHAFAGFDQVLAGGVVNLLLDAAAEFLSLVLHTLDHIGDA